MATVAEQLRAGREAQSLTVHQIAEITKIRTDHIRALEEGNFDVFSAPVYIRGFVRNYGTLLKLNVAELMAELDRELGATEKFSEPPPLTPQSRGALDVLTLLLSKVDWRKGLIALGVVAVLGVIAIVILIVRHQKTADPLRDLGDGLYQPAPAESGEVLPLPQTPRQR